METKKIKIPIYYGHLTIHVCDSLSEVEIKYNLTDTSMYDAISLRGSFNDGQSRYVIALTKNPSPATIAHEASHIVNKIFLDRGIRLDSDNDEPQCYLLGWVVEQCHKFLEGVE